jgi:protoporphyrinogen oxidase
VLGGDRPDASAAGDGPDADSSDRVLLVRQRRSRIYFAGKFFDYPIRMDLDTVRKLGLVRTSRMAFSYAKAMAFPYRPPANLEQFLINRFGRELYSVFFRSYTEKVWGQPCDQISADWGAQRIKGFSISKAVSHFLRQLVRRKQPDVSQTRTETTLIEQFLYPKLGPGQMWETVADEIRRRGGQVLTRKRVTRLEREARRVTSLHAEDTQTGNADSYQADYFFSTMPICDLIEGLRPHPPDDVRQVACGLPYRDFITVGLLLNRLRERRVSADVRETFAQSTWIYVQEPGLSVSRLQLFNNWSPYLLSDPTKLWIGLEFFCREGDALWELSDEAMIDLAASELTAMGVADVGEVLDGTVIRVPKAYPAYFGAYARLGEVIDYLDDLQNLYLIGRNGMHKYNNQDHSMLTAMLAVDNIIAGRNDRANIWNVNTESQYQEE